MGKRDLVRAALQMPTFHGLGVADDQRFDHIARTTQSAERAGFDSVFVMDHLYQLMFLGGATQPMLEGYMLLSALAARTERVNLGTLVTGVTYRNPAHLGKIVTTLDVISGGRAICGIGAAWYEEEHRAFGFDFPNTATRFEMLDEAITILTTMFRESSCDFTGRHFRTEGLVNVPAPLRVGGPPLLLGGSGERKTIPMAARRADAINFNCMVDEVPHKMEVLHRSLDAVGRDRDDINVTLLVSLVTAEGHAEVEDLLRNMVRGRGMDPAMLDDAGFRAGLTSRMLVGTWDEIAERLGTLMGQGIDGCSFMLPAHVSDATGPESVAEALRRAGLITRR